MKRIFRFLVHLAGLFCLILLFVDPSEDEFFKLFCRIGFGLWGLLLICIHSDRIWSFKIHLCKTMGDCEDLLNDCPEKFKAEVNEKSAEILEGEYAE